MKALLEAIRRRIRGGDDGFTLLESIITISLITVIMTALASFFMTAMASTSEQRARQLAVQLADTEMERLRSLNVADVLTANGASPTSTFDAPSTAQVYPWLGDMSAAAEVPARTTTLNGTKYATTTYLGTCYLASTDCVKSSATGVAYLRGVVAVTWPDQHCANGTCAYVTATLLSNAVDPLFNLNATPPPVPQLPAELCDQMTVAGDPVPTFPLKLTAGTGAGTLTWIQLTSDQSGHPLPANQMLPPGLGITSAGAIAGSLDRTVTPTDYKATIQVTDGFARSETAPCTWHVQPPLSIASVANPTDTVGVAVNSIALNASGGTGTGYVFTATGLPSGVAVSGSTLAGTPSLPGSYPVQVSVTDSQNHTASTQFTWQVNPPPRTSTLGRAIAQYQLQLGSGSGSYTWSDPKLTLPLGLTISNGGLITGTPRSTGTNTVKLTATDTATRATVTLTFPWTVVPTPTVTAPSAQATTTGGSVNLPVASACMNTPCSYTLTNAPAGLGISTSAIISGQITSTPQTFSSVTVTVTDAAGATGSATFAWTVNPKPTVASPGNQTVDATWSDSLSVPALVSGGTGPFTYSASGLPSWLTIDPDTGMISGTAPTSTGTTANITVTAKDAYGFSATSPAFSWVVNPALTLTDPGNQAGDLSQPDSVTVVAGGGTTPYTFSATGLPKWLSIDKATGQITGTAPGKTSVTSNITVTVTDATNATLTSAPFSWTVNPVPNLTVPAQTSTLNSSVSTPMKSYLTGGTRPYTFSAAGLPTGLTINASTGVVSGTPTAAGSYTVTVWVSDASNVTDSSRFTWKVQ